MSGRWRKLHREGLHNLCFSSSIEIRNSDLILRDFGLPPRCKRVLRVGWLLIDAALERRSRAILFRHFPLFCIIRKLSQVSTEFVSLPRPYGQMKRCYYRQCLLFYTCTALCRLIRTLVGTGRTIANTLLEDIHTFINTFAASYLNTQGLNNSCLNSPASTLVDLTFQSLALRSFSLNQLRNLSL